MPRPRPPHIQREVTRHGRVMWYFRRVKGGPRIRLPDTYGTQEFWEAYRAALAGEQPRINAPARGSLSWLIEEYKRSSKWRELGPSTQRVRDRLLARVAAKAGHVMARQITRAAIQRGMDDLSDRPEAANAFLKTMRQLLAYGVRIDALPVNVAEGVEAMRSRTGGHPTWTVEQVEAYEARHPVGTKARLAFDLLLYTGLRKADIVALGWRHLKGDVLEIRPQKTARSTGVVVHQRIPQALLDSIAATSVVGAETFIVTDYGKPFTANGFGNWFRERCDEAGVPGSAHGLRKAGAIRAAENGATAHELMALFGWVNLKEAELYTRDADRKRLALEASKKMSRT